MDARIESAIAAANKLLFPDEKAPAHDYKQHLNLSIGDISVFVTIQICLPVITGLMGSVLYDKFKSVSNRQEALSAMIEAEQFLLMGGNLSPVNRDELKTITINTLMQNGFSAAEANPLSDQLINTTSDIINDKN